MKGHGYAEAMEHRHKQGEAKVHDMEDEFVVQQERDREKSPRQDGRRSC